MLIYLFFYEKIKQKKNRIYVSIYFVRERKHKNSIAFGIDKCSEMRVHFAPSL